jgi:hypothetical protein
MKLWLRGGAGAVQMVLLFKWSKWTNSRVKGFVEVYNLDLAGNVNLIQTEVIINQSNTLRFLMKLIADGTRPFSQYQPLQLRPQLK